MLKHTILELRETIFAAWADAVMPDQEYILSEYEPYIEDCETLIKGRTWQQIISILMSHTPDSRCHYFEMHIYLSPNEKHYLTPVFLDLILEHEPGKVSPLSFINDLMPYEAAVPRQTDKWTDESNWMEFFSLFSREQKDAVALVLELCPGTDVMDAATYWRTH